MRNAPMTTDFRDDQALIRRQHRYPVSDPEWLYDFWKWSALCSPVLLGAAALGMQLGAQREVLALGLLGLFGLGSLPALCSWLLRRQQSRCVPESMGDNAEQTASIIVLGEPVECYRATTASVVNH
jgi:hypothetical protein